MTRKQLIVFLLVGVIMATGAIAAAAPPTGATIGKTLPKFSLPALDGHLVTISPSSDKILILNFWATRCPPCRREMPDLNEYYIENQGKVAFYTINLQEDPAKVNAFMYNKGYSIPTLVDIDGRVGHLFQVQAIPTTIVVDRNGVIQFRYEGSITKQQLEADVNSLL